MNKASGHWAARVGSGGVWPCALLLIGTVALLYLTLTPLAFWRQGAVGLRSAASAALICMLAGLAVLAVTHHSGLRAKPLVSMLLATAMRMVPLLATGVVVALASDRGEHFDFVCYLVFFYIATLAVETYVSVQLVHLPQELTPASRESHAREPQA